MNEEKCCFGLSLCSPSCLPGIHMFKSKIEPNPSFYRRGNRDQDREHNWPEIPQLTQWMRLRFLL